MKNGQPKILIVNEEEFVLQYFVTLFENHTVFTASSFQDATGILASTPDIEVIIADTDSQTHQLIPYCKANFPDVVRVMVTADTDTNRILSAVDRGDVYRFISKPFSNVELIQTVHQASENYRIHRKARSLATQHATLNTQLENEVNQQTRHLEERNLRLQEVNEFKDELMMVAAHDIRSPLAVMVGYANLLLEGHYGLNVEGRRVLGRIQIAGTRLLAMVNNILSLSALEKGELGLETEPVRLSEVVGAVVDNFLGLIEEKQIRFTQECECEEKYLMLDRTKVEQVLQNLMTNAIKYSGAGGEIKLSCRGDAKLVTCFVEDTGRGMTPEQAQRAFDKFSRFGVDNEQGSGLGLAIAKSIVELHGGKIQVSSTPDRGSRFTFTLKPGRP